MNIQKRRITYSSILFILIIIGAVIGGRMLLRKSSHTNSNETISNQEGFDYEREYLRRIDERCSQMSESELLRYKSSCEKTLEDIHLELDSDSLNPEEIHENILSKCFIEQELEIVKKHLQK